MNLFEYLKWRYEENERKTKAKKIDKIEEKISELCGEAEGLKEQIRMMEYTDRNLIFSNISERCALMADYTKAIARKTYLAIKLEELKK